MEGERFPLSVRHWFLGFSLIEDRFSTDRLRWLEQVLRMSAERLPRSAWFMEVGRVWRMGQGGQSMT